MPTYAQLQTEPWWDREVVTPALDWLGDELCRRTGRPRTAAGTKGDDNHLRGSHRSQEWILRSAYCTSRTYTVQQGLTAEQLRWVAGFDFTPGSAEQMIAQSRRLMAAMKAGQLDEVLEFYGNVDGDQVVDGFDNLRDRPAGADRSHLWHWHLGIDRRHCADRALMERILAIALGLPLEDDMPTVSEIWAAQGNATDGRRTMASAVVGAYNNTVEATKSLARQELTQQAILAKVTADDGQTETILRHVDQLAATLVPPSADEIADATVRRLGEQGPEDAAESLVAVLGPDRARQLTDALAARLPS